MLRRAFPSQRQRLNKYQGRSVPPRGEQVATDGAFLRGFSLNAKPLVNCGGNDGMRAGAERGSGVGVGPSGARPWPNAIGPYDLPNAIRPYIWRPQTQSKRMRGFTSGGAMTDSKFQIQDSKMQDQPTSTRS